MKAVSRFHVSSTAVDLDKEFETLLATLDLDVEDRITQTLTWNGDYHPFVFHNLRLIPFQLCQNCSPPH